MVGKELLRVLQTRLASFSNGVVPARVVSSPTALGAELPSPLAAETGKQSSVKVAIPGEAFGLSIATNPTDSHEHSAKKQRVEERVVHDVTMHDDSASVLAKRAEEAWKMVDPATVMLARRDSQTKQQLKLVANFIRLRALCAKTRTEHPHGNTA